MAGDKKLNAVSINESDIQFNLPEKTYTIKNIPKLMTEKLNVFVKLQWNDNRLSFAIYTE